MVRRVLVLFAICCFSYPGVSLTSCEHAYPLSATSISSKRRRNSHVHTGRSFDVRRVLRSPVVTHYPRRCGVCSNIVIRYSCFWCLGFSPPAPPIRALPPTLLCAMPCCSFLMLIFDACFLPPWLRSWCGTHIFSVKKKKTAGASHRGVRVQRFRERRLEFGGCPNSDTPIKVHLPCFLFLSCRVYFFFARARQTRRELDPRPITGDPVSVCLFVCFCSKQSCVWCCWQNACV